MAKKKAIHSKAKTQTGKTNPVKKSFSSEKKFHFFAIAGIILLCSIIYSDNLYSSFHLDDFHSIVNNNLIRSFTAFTSPSYWFRIIDGRPLSFFSFALNFHFNGLNVSGYHLVNNVIQIIASLSVYWFVLLLFSTQIIKEYKTARYSKGIALFAALIFAAHPIQTQAVTYIVQRMASMAAMFYILSLCFYIKGRQEQINRKLSLRAVIYYLFTFISFIMAIMSKETAFTLPVMILLVEIFFIRDKNNRSYKKYIWLFSSGIIIVVIFNIVFWGLPRETTGISRFDYLITQFKVLVTYLRLLVLPVNQKVFYDFPVVKSFFNLTTILSFLFLAAVFVSGIFLYKRHRLLSFSIFWFFLTLSIESSIFPIRDVIFEHRLYLPMTGFAIFATVSIFYLFAGKYKREIIWGFSIIVLIFSISTFERNLVWKTGVSLWTDNIKKTPDNPRVYYSRGHVYSLQGLNEKAVEDYTRSIKFDSTNALVYNDRGVAYNQLGDYQLATKDLIKAIKLMPDIEAAYINLGITYTDTKDFSKALTIYGNVIKRFPDNPKGYFGIANIYAKLGNYKQAISDYKKTLNINPYFIDAYSNLGSTYNVSGQYQKAIECFTKALQINPYQSKVYKERASAYFQIKDYKSAINDYTEALNLSPKDPESYFYRALSYYFNNQPNRAWNDANRAKNLGYPVTSQQMARFKAAL